MYGKLQIILRPYRLLIILQHTLGCRPHALMLYSAQSNTQVTLTQEHNKIFKSVEYKTCALLFTKARPS